MSTETPEAPFVKTLPSIKKEWFGKGFQNHYDMRNGGYFWTVKYPALGLEKWEGKDTRNSAPIAFWTLLGDDTRYLSNNTMIRAYWLREGGAAYAKECEAQGITTLDPEVLASPGVDWRAIQRAEEERLEELRAKSRAEREARRAERVAQAEAADMERSRNAP